MKEKIIKVYEFKELSEEIKEKVLAKHRNINTDFNNCLDCENEYWKEKIEEKGFTDVDIFYDVSYCQGSGACFGGGISTVNIGKFLTDKKYDVLKNLIEKNYIEIYGSILTNSGSNHYFHKHTRYFEITDNFYPEGDKEFYNIIKKNLPKLYNQYKLKLIIDDEKEIECFFVEVEKAIENLIDDLEKDIEELRQDICDEMYKSFCKYYEDLESDEAVIDTIEANDYEFDIEGNIL